MKFLNKSMILTALLVAGCASNYTKVDVTASIFPHYDLVRQLTNDTTITEALVVSPGVEVHTYTPTPQQTKQIHDSKLFFYTSDTIETWVQNMNIVDTKVINVHQALFSDDQQPHIHEVEDDHDHHHGVHYWTSPHNFLLELYMVKDELIDQFPDFVDEINENANLYHENIETIAGEFLEYLTSIQTKSVFYVGHNALEDFADFFGIEIISLVDDIKPDADPTAQDLARLADAIIESDVTVLYTEELAAPTFANTLKNELQSKHNRDITILELHGYHNVSLTDFENNTSYLDLLSRNILNLKEVLA